MPEPSVDELKRRIADLEVQIKTLRPGEAAKDGERAVTSVEPRLRQDLNLAKFIQSLTDTATKLIGGQCGSFFCNMPDDRIGLAQDGLGAFPMAPDAELFALTFRNHDVVRYGDITRETQSRKTARRNANSEGQFVVRSYLAAPVVSRSGEVLGGLFFGHADCEKFTKQHEALISAVAAQAAIAIDNARVFEQTQWTQEELKHSNEDLRRANRDLETFAYSAGHDLQEPLRKVVISAQLLERALGISLSGDPARFLQGILQGARRMETLLKDLQSYAYATKHADGAAPKIDAAHVLAGVVDNLSSRIHETGAAITATDLPQLCIHEIHLTQVLQNLISNSLKYRRATEAPRVHLSACREDAWWVISVADNGIGIDPEYADQIFELFKRLHSQSEYSGSGVGLAICRRIVEQYGGRIWLEESVRGLGSTFRFCLPELGA